MKILLVVLVLLTVGCQKRRTLVVDGSAFRVVPRQGGGLLLPPPVADGNGMVAFVMPWVKTVKADCVLGDVRLEPGRLVLKVDSNGPAEGVMELRRRGCLDEATGMLVRRLLRESLPMRPNDALYGLYGYRPGVSSVDLREGVRLKVVQALFEKPVEQRRSATDGYTGLRAETIDCIEDGRGFVSVGKLGGARRMYRFLMLTHFVKTKVSRQAVLLGADRLADMEEMERRLREDPGRACRSVRMGGRNVCVAFEGEVTVSPEVLVTVNGEKKALGWGTTVKMAAGSAKTVTLRRLWMGKLRSVVMEADPETVGATMLVGGDELEFR